MQKIYSSECSNFRDVGKTINHIAQKKILRENCLYRGGSTEYVTQSQSIAYAKSIINLKNTHDRNHFGAKYFYVPLSNDINKYDTSLKSIHQWLNDVMHIFNSKDLSYPLFIHCSAGKDRTGVVIAALLKILKIPDEWIIEEYMKSEGKINSEDIIYCLKNISDPGKYFKSFPDFDLIQSRLGRQDSYYKQILE
jgi:protein-tyrosine phosphatase